MPRLICAVLIALTMGAAGAAKLPKEKLDLTGYAYDLESGKYLYSEHHAFEYEGDTLVADKVTYRDAEGKVFGRKDLNFRPNLFVPDFRTVLTHIDYEEGLRRRGGKVELFRRKPGETEVKTKTIDDLDNTAADAGFHPYVQANFDKLMSGDTVKFEFLSADFLTGVKFKAKRIDDGQFEGRSVARFKVKIASFIGLFVDPLIVSYDPKTRYLVQFEGISNVKGTDGESYETRIIYPAKPPPEAPAIKPEG